MKDTDATKLAQGAQSDSMFEELQTGKPDAWDMLSGSTTNSNLEGEQSTPPAEVTPPEATPPEGETPPAEVTPPEAPVVPELETPPEDATETPDDDTKAIETISAALGLKSEDLIKAGENLQQAATSGDPQEMKKKLAEFEIAKKDMEYQNSLLQEQLANERENSKRYLDEKWQAELDSREKSKVYSTIMDNEGLKNLVLYKQYSETNPDYADKYKEVLRQFFEKEYGVSLDSLLSQSKVAEKSAMDTGGNIFGGQPKQGELVGGMFEEL